MSSVTHTQTFIKTLSWRVLATTDTFLISWLLTGTVAIAASIASLEVITKMVLYYIHERAWAYDFSKRNS